MACAVFVEQPYELHAHLRIVMAGYLPAVDAEFEIPPVSIHAGNILIPPIVK